jgi:hypothetical protein
MHLISFLLGVYLTGVVFSVFAAYTDFAFDNHPEWVKVLTSLVLAALWPIGAICLGFMWIKESIT